MVQRAPTTTGTVQFQFPTFSQSLFQDVYIGFVGQEQKINKQMTIIFLILLAVIVVLLLWLDVVLLMASSKSKQRKLVSD